MKNKHAQRIVFALLLTFTLLLAACGNNAANNNAAESAGTGESAAAATASAAGSAANGSATDSANGESSTRIIKTVTGDVEIPVNPQRVVTDGYLPNLLLLGIKPVGSTQWDLENKVIADQIEGIENTGERSLEKMLDLDPDLIITWINPASDAKIIEQYEKIAPTIAIPYGEFKDVHDAVNYFADIFGKQDAAEQWLADFDKDVQTAREQIGGVVKPEDTFALMGVFVVDKGFYVYGDGNYRGGEAIYKQLGLNPPAKQKAEMIGKEEYRQISYEVVGDYAGDYIFLDQGDMISEVWGEDEGVWKSLDAVKNNRVFQLDPDLFWGNDPISLRLQVQELARIITERAGS
ncbi:ABC transporter substrate-binding protein [Cohnella fermenti]|nr:ABC transporter substrate-binding protein [Cohnella fermenti]